MPAACGPHLWPHGKPLALRLPGVPRLSRHGARVGSPLARLKACPHRYQQGWLARFQGVRGSPLGSVHKALSAVNDNFDRPERCRYARQQCAIAVTAHLQWQRASKGSKTFCPCQRLRLMPSCL